MPVRCHRILMGVVCWCLGLGVCAGEGRTLVAHLGRDDGDPTGFAAIQAAFRTNNPGCDLEYRSRLLRWPASKQPRIVFVQAAKPGTRASVTGRVDSEVTPGDIIVLRKADSLRLSAAIAALIFRTEEAVPDSIPSFVRPEHDRRIEDAPGGCATQDGAYRRILLTWLAEKGPYVYHALNAHRVLITDSFTHYHPRQGGFDEFYLVQAVEPGARLITSHFLAAIRDPDTVREDQVPSLLETHPLAVGDLVYMPRGVVHRGLGGVLAQVIAVPGFRPGAEIGVDAELRRINARLGLQGESALPFRVESALDARSDIRFVAQSDRVRIFIGDALFTEYIHAGQPKPILHPVLGAGGTPMTRNWPILERDENEARDHPHHRSLWFAHGDVNGHDFWAEGKERGRIEHVEFVDRAGWDRGILTTRNRWVAADGAVVCTDTRTLQFGTLGSSRVLDFQLELHASQGKVTLGDTKEGTMAMRLTPYLRMKGKVADGTAVNSEGGSGPDIWGKRARWIDYSGQVQGKTVGVAIFDHPTNPSHPTWWHARDYGLFAANPFGVHDFEGKPKGTGDREIPAGQSLTFRYRILFHEGTAKTARVGELYREFAK